MLVSQHINNFLVIQTHLLRWRSVEICSLSGAEFSDQRIAQDGMLHYGLWAIFYGEPTVRWKPGALSKSGNPVPPSLFGFDMVSCSGVPLNQWTGTERMSTPCQVLGCLVMKPAVFMPNHWKGIVKSQLSMPRPLSKIEKPHVELEPHQKCVKGEATFCATNTRTRWNHNTSGHFRGQHCSDGRACSFPNLDLHMLVTRIFKIPWHQIMASTHWILASCFDPAYGWKRETINSEASIMFVRIHCLGSVSAYVYHSTSCCESLSTKQSHGSATTIPSLLILIQKIVSKISRPHFAPSTGYPSCPCLGKTVIINTLTEPSVDLHNALSVRAVFPVWLGEHSDFQWPSRLPWASGMRAGCQIPIFGFFEFQWSSESVWKIMSKVPIHLWMGWKERLLKNDVLEIRGHKAPLKKSHGRVGIPVSKRLSSI